MLVEVKRLEQALKLARKIKGRVSGDECQVWVGEYWYHFLKDGKAWKLIVCEKDG